MSHFFERISKKTIGFEEECGKIVTLLNKEYSYQTAIDYIDSYCFGSMKLACNYLTVNSMINETLSLKKKENRFIHLSELVLSICEQINLSYIPYPPERDFVHNQLYSCRNLINYDLSKLNLEARIIESSMGDVASIGPKNELLEKALELVDDNSIENRLVRYNSKDIIGKIDEKEEILCSLYSFVEGLLKDSQLCQMNRRLFNNVDFLYNNLNMKHNNDKFNDTFFYEATLSKREKWLDNLFHEVLLVIASKKEQRIDFDIKELKTQKKNYANKE